MELSVLGKKAKSSELDENIQIAESNHDSVKMKWDIIKSLHYGNNYSEKVGSPAKSSTSSFSNHNIMLSDTNKNENVEYYNDNEDHDLSNNVGEENQVQIVFTPRSQTNDTRSHNSLVQNLQLDMDESLENLKSSKHEKKRWKLKKRTNSHTTIDESLKTSFINVGKRKKKKFYRRLKTSNSKSTVTTRETNFSDKKTDRRKFKREKSLDTISLFQKPQYRKRANALRSREAQQNPKDFIEIYHNKAAKSGSFTAISRQSKGKSAQISQLDKDGAIIIESDDCKKNDAPIEEESIENLLRANEMPKDEELIKSDEPIQIQEHPYDQPGLYDPFNQRNYQMPTMSSKMKRVDQQYYNRFNIHNIPFVNGTSISPSHNLGLNIQQILSIIKTKQPTIPGISPLLIRNVYKGTKPVANLFQYISHEFAKSCRAFNAINDNNQSQKSFFRYENGGGSVSCDQLHTNQLNTSTPIPFKQSFTCEPLYEEDEESYSVFSEGRAKSQERQTAESRVESSGNASKCYHQSQYNLHKQSKSFRQQFCKSAFGDLGGNNINHATDDKGMMQVFSGLYEQFNKMITEHGKMKEQLERRRDKSLLKELSGMEEALNAKQQEITTVINLYKEVLFLKKQMKLHHERNSLVCIATEDPSFNHISRTMKTQRRAQTAGPIEDHGQGKYLPRRRSNNINEAPNALQLVGLLRQIQAFQRQLVMA